jgi:ATP-dependent Clp protease adaptor protein ClpS
MLPRNFTNFSASSPAVQIGGGAEPFWAGPKRNEDGDTLVITETEQKEDLATPWNVIVYNDPVNLMGYVTMVIRRIFGYSEEKATGMMLDVHQKGLCVVWSGEKEKAELYVRQLQGYQLLAAMKKTSD